MRVDEDDIAAVADTYRSGWLSQGPRTAELEEAFAAFTGARFALGVANGTAGLHLICLAAGIGPGDEVIVPSMTFVATVNAVAYTGATPVFADIASVIEPWLSAAAVEAAITPKTKAVMGMSYGGHAGETAALAQLCADRGITFLEDAAHGAGSRLDGRHLGTFGVAGAYSMFSNKNLAVGEGGLVTTDDEDLHARMKLLRSHGMTTMSWDRHRGHATTYDVVALGYNYRIDEARATLATRRLAKLDAENDARRRLDGRYRELLAGVDVECALLPTEGLTSAHHLFTVVVPEGADRDGVRQALADARIQTSMHYPPSHHFSMYEAAGAELPVTDAYASRTVTLPMYAHMTDDQQDLVVDALSSALSSRGAAAGRPA